MSVVVSDTTPLNYVILIGNIDVLPRLFGKVLIPPAVICELSHPKTPAAVAAWTRTLPEWLEFEAAVSRLRATNFRFSEIVLEKIRAAARTRKQS